MNSLEKQMVDVLKKLREVHGSTAVKASMEAEGISLSEMLRTKEMTMAAGLGFTVKIGGCEALTDIRLARSYGVGAVMGPMIESRFALEKYLAMAEAVFSEAERKEITLLINIETMDAFRKIEEILSAENVRLLNGIVLGRTDLGGALRVRNLDGPEVLEIAKRLFRIAKERSLIGIVGGGITEKSIPFLGELEGLIDGFETRKVVFGRYRKDPAEMREAIRLALRFEALWCKWRCDTYSRLAEEDAGRMKKIEAMLG